MSSFPAAAQKRSARSRRSSRFVLWGVWGTAICALTLLLAHHDYLQAFCMRQQSISSVFSSELRWPIPQSTSYPRRLIFSSTGPSNPFTILRLYRKTGLTADRLAKESIVWEGDQVQIQYSTDQPYGTILSVDGRGVITMHFPDTPAQSTRIPTGTHVLPFAFELDDAPGFERFIFVTSNTPIEMAKVLASAAQIHAPADLLPPSERDMQTDSVVLHKLPATHQENKQ